MFIRSIHCTTATNTVGVIEFGFRVHIKANILKISSTAGAFGFSG